MEGPRSEAGTALRVERERLERHVASLAGRIGERVSIDFAVGDDAWGPDLVVGRLNDALGDGLSSDIVARWFADHPDCTVILSGRAAFASRVAQRLGRSGVEVVQKLKRKGFSARCLRRKRR